MKTLSTFLWTLLLIAAVSVQPVCGSIVVGWGENGSGAASPPSGLSDAISVAAGGYTSMALKADGTVRVWGSACAPPAGLSGVIAIAMGSIHALAVKSDHTVVSWGSNAYGQTDVPLGLNDVVAVAAGNSHSLALRSDGTVVAWGRNNAGQCTPPAGLPAIAAIAACRDHCLALTTAGEVIGWGDTYGGACIPPAGLEDVKAISTGPNHSLALKTDGTVVGWGSNVSGQTTPPPGLCDVTAIAAGCYFSMAIKSDGSVVLWGSNRDSIRTPPYRLGGVTAIAGGDGHCLALANMSNVPPVANAGADRAVEATSTGTSFGLNAGESTDADGDTLRYTWRNSSGSIEGTSQVVVCNRPVGTYTFTVTAFDYYGGSSTDSVTITIRDTQPPKISNVVAIPAMSAPGDPMRIELTASDATRIASLQVDGVPASQQCGSVWAANIQASSLLGPHTISVTASDGINAPIIDTTGSYTTTRLFGVGCRQAARMIPAATNKWVFKTWGKVRLLDSTRIELTDGSGSRILVMASGYSGLVNGDYAAARGVLDRTTNPPTLKSIGPLVQKLTGP